MQPKPDLQRAHVERGGQLIDALGRPTGWAVPGGGREILDASGQIVGTITPDGRVFDRYGRFIAEVARDDLRSG